MLRGQAMGMQLELLVSTVSGKNMTVLVNENDTVECLQKALAREWGCPIDKQVLFLQSRTGRLCPDNFIRDYGFNKSDRDVLLIWDLPPRPEGKAPVPPSFGMNRTYCINCGTSKEKIQPFQKPPNCTCKPKRRRPQQKVIPRPMPPRPNGPAPTLVTPGHELGKSDAMPVPSESRLASPEGGLAAGRGAQQWCLNVEAQYELPPLPMGSPPRSVVAAAAAFAASTPPIPEPLASLSIDLSTPQHIAGSKQGSEATLRSGHNTSGGACAPPVPLPAGRGANVGQSPRGRRIRRADLDRVGRLGVGAFGVVTLEADRRTGRTYALKAVSKGYLASLSMEYSVLNEKKILRNVDSPFVVRLLATYNGKEHVYFLLEAALGGELFTTYERLRLYGSDKHARFYVACVVEALDHLHNRNVIYRDLKPENLLLDARGYCKLTDMGLAKVSQGLTFTLVGTPDYMAPEVIKQTGHGRSVDWWMLGVLLFELLAGKAPFEAPKTDLIYEQVKRGIDQVVFPPECRGPSADLVKSLCRLDPNSRLRTPSLRDHAWFRVLDWQALRTLRLSPPFQPRVKGPRDLSNFRPCDQEDPPAVHYVDNGSGWDHGFEDDTIPEALLGAASSLNR
eukprot:TRINITY_DN34718_c0_g2_i1.p1 TRINITY_DN34718_c0_g2~~TRINITY_DN34718_c0_g2_i1.p1  ORF type:complete len:620 (+),score=71.63 TRINITY_DN34718_c0_g2_i1:60-1919(+)